MATLFYGLKKLFCGLSTPPFPGLDGLKTLLIFDLQAEYIRRGFDPALFKEFFHMLLTKALDVKSVARDEMIETQHNLGGTNQPSDTFASDLPFNADGMAAADRTFVGKHESLSIGGTFVFYVA